MKQYDRVRAVFRPKRTDDLAKQAADYIGQEGEFEAAWIIEDGPYVDQWAMTIPRDWRGPFSWVPECDLEIGPWRADFSAGSVHRGATMPTRYNAFEIISEDAEQMIIKHSDGTTLRLDKISGCWTTVTTC